MFVVVFAAFAKFLTFNRFDLVGFTLIGLDFESASGAGVVPKEAA